jgi:hypothetical protein
MGLGVARRVASWQVLLIDSSQTTSAFRAGIIRTLRADSKFST